MTVRTDQDVVDVLIAQHERIVTVLARLRMGGGEKRERFAELVRLLAVHESAEEEIVHPVARRADFGGDDVTKPLRKQENDAKLALADLYDLGVDHPEFDGRLAEFADAVTEHAAREESEEFPLLREQLSTRQLHRMGESVRAAETLTPPGQLTGPPLAVFDRMRDAVRGWRNKKNA